VWVFTGALFAGSTLLWLFHLRDLEQLVPELTISWLLIGVAFAISEAFVVHLHFRANSGAFSLLEIVSSSKQ